MDKSLYNDMIRQVVPSGALIEATKNEMKACMSKLKPSRRTRRFIAVAAVLVLALATTTIVFGGDIAAVLRQVSFNRSEATQIENTDSIDFHVRMGVVSREPLVVEENYGDGVLEMHDDGQTRSAYYETIDEARLNAPFELAEPAYLPDSVIGFSGSFIYHFAPTQAPDKYEVSLSYDVDVPNSFGITGGKLSLVQEYVGPDAHLEITTIFQVEPVMVGDIEAVYSYHDAGSNGPSDSDPFYEWSHCSITWTKNGYLYTLLNTAMWADSLFDLDTMIAIAESV